MEKRSMMLPSQRFEILSSGWITTNSELCHIIAKAESLPIADHPPETKTISVAPKLTDP
jgi:hypothetical protein